MPTIPIEYALTILASVAAVGTATVGRWVERKMVRDVDAERSRLLRMLAQDDTARRSVGTRQRSPRHEPDEVPKSTGDAESASETPPTSRSDSADRFTPLLVEYYAYGLAQAKRHSVLSLSMSALGGIVVIVGVASLILRGQNGDAIAGSALTTAAGVLTNAIAVLFHRQANQALKHMQDQTVALRDDMRKETQARQALEQLDLIADDALRDRHRAGVVLRLSESSLPDIEISRGERSDRAHAHTATDNGIPPVVSGGVSMQAKSEPSSAH